MRCKGTAKIRGRVLGALACAAVVCAYAGSGVAADVLRPDALEDRLEKPGETGALAARFRMRRLRDGGAPAIGADAGDAKRFSARLKLHQRRHFSKKRREFRQQLQRMETQRRVRKARIKARAFAAARRHAAQHAPGRRKKTIEHSKDSLSKQPRGAAG